MPDVYKLQPVSFRQVQLNQGFFGMKQAINTAQTIPHIYAMNEKTGRFEAWKLDWTQESDKPRPHIFWDSDAAKWIEASAYSLATHSDENLERKVDAVIERIAQAQQPDGYLNIYFTSVEPDKRWTNLRDCHELYCAGHMLEAAIAYFEATKKDRLLKTMIRYIDYIDTVFGPEDGKKRGYPGHEEIELALVKLYRLTGDRKYLNLAKFFIDERGQQPHYYDSEARLRGEDPEAWKYGPYQMLQAHVPVRQQTEVVGHAVRATYLFSGALDVAHETDDAELVSVCRALWDNLIQKRMYITGGIGSSRHNEGFTLDYDLPNESAYAETCAAIGLVFWSSRMLQMNGERQYADIVEKCLYNNVMAGVSLDGRKFFYDNPLASRGNRHRQVWFDCACCPPNIARLLASVGGYAFSTAEHTVFIHQFFQSTAAMEVGSHPIRLSLTTYYPWEETVQISVQPEKRAEFQLAIRLPGWCRNPHIAVNGIAFDHANHVQKGYTFIHRTWRAGDMVTLRLPMPVERIEARPEVGVNGGRVALLRGPVIYCLEQADNGPVLNDIVLSEQPGFRTSFDPDLLGGVVTIRGKALRRQGPQWSTDLYRPMQGRYNPIEIKAIPYFAWDNRTPGEMLVWIRSQV
ncbi:MAG: glycoside hydrolase family 127 protein [Candidatus Zhuqueibacterota bacterium]